MNYDRLSRDYIKNPLKPREMIPFEDLVYLFIELNYCYEKISKIVGKSACAVSKTCKKYGLIKTKERQKESLQNHYLETIGVKNPSLLKSSRDKIKETVLKRYGVENVALKKETIEKRKKTCLERYGETNPTKLKEVKEKIKQTCLKKYGVEYAQQNEKVKERQQNTCLERYGCRRPLQNKEIKQKQEQTCLERYGTKNPFLKKEIQLKQKLTVQKKYGVDNVSQVKQFAEKVINTKKIRGNLNTSSIETNIEDLLKVKFPDLKTQYNKDSRYPFTCDFYIPKLDLFIEYQGFVSHGKKPYGIDSQYDEGLLKKWWDKVHLFEQKNPSLSLYKCSYYNYIQTWTVSDPLKRKIAKENNLNWIEFFSMKEFLKWYNSLN